MYPSFWLELHTAQAYAERLRRAEHARPLVEARRYEQHSVRAAGAVALHRRLAARLGTQLVRLGAALQAAVSAEARDPAETISVPSCGGTALRVGG